MTVVCGRDAAVVAIVVAVTHAVAVRVEALHLSVVVPKHILRDHLFMMSGRDFLGSIVLTL